jgi:mono/diheme cytochrome c family protein
VKVLPEEIFDAWVTAWRTPPATDGNPETADVVEVPRAFGVCLACHRVNGTNAAVALQGMPGLSGYIQGPLDTNEADAVSEENPRSAAADSQIIPGPGPNLTLLACRDTIAAGLLENTPQNLETWLKHTEEVKEGVYMPNYYKQGTINDEQVAELVTYLESLKPAGGCPDEGLLVGGQVPRADVDVTDPHPDSGIGTPVAH